MLNLKPKYIVNDKSKKIAVQVDINTYNKMVELLEDYGLVKLMDETKGDEEFTLEEGKKYYATLKKID